MKIVLVCMAGMSTSLLVENMKKYAEPEDRITAMSYTELEHTLDGEKVDVVLLGPQIKMHYDELKDICDRRNVKIAILAPVVYGRMDGTKAMEMAKTL